MASKVSRSFILRSVVALCLLSTTAAFAQPELAIKAKGKQIYDKLCAECHGFDGEGVREEYDDPLIGNHSLEWLSGRIHRTMPDYDTDLCKDDDAKAVATYMYDAFYSPAAQLENRPVRIELTRLTVPQLKTSLMDLVSYFYKGYSPYAAPENERGLKAKYYGTRNHRGDKEKEGKDIAERVDGLVKFDFKENSPFPDKFGSEEFSIRWDGVLIAPSTGTYEFVLRTKNGARLWINDTEYEKMLIDGYVNEGQKVRDERGSIYLIGGRTYTLKIDYFSYKEKESSIELLWTPPHGMMETVPTRVLAPGWSYQNNVVSTLFPADDRSVGYERGSDVSRQWLESVTKAGLETADHVIANLPNLSGTKNKAPREELVKNAREFCYKFAERAMRRPLTDEQRWRLVDRHWKDEPRMETAVKRVVLASTTAPEFLYPELAHTGDKKNDHWARADRLALAMWDSLPDHDLVKAAREGKLANEEQLMKQGHRMLWSRLTRAKMHGFFEHWLELERAADVTKDMSKFPGFDPAVLADLRVSLDLFIDQVIWQEHHENYKKLLLGDTLFLNNRLAEFYGKTDQTKGAQFVKATFPQQRRAGVITHPYLLASFAYHNNTSPIHRGVFLTRSIVGMSLKPPPNAIEFKDSEFDPNLTMREKVTELTRSQACMACHTTINPLGFALENYDAIGRWRVNETASDRPINPNGELATSEGTTIEIKGARDVAMYAANSPAAHRSFVTNLFEYSIKQAPAAYGADTVEKLRELFQKKGYNVRDLFIQIAIEATLGPDNSAEMVAQK